MSQDSQSWSQTQPLTSFSAENVANPELLTSRVSLPSPVPFEHPEYEGYSQDATSASAVPATPPSRTVRRTATLSNMAPPPLRRAKGRTSTTQSQRSSSPDSMSADEPTLHNGCDIIVDSVHSSLDLPGPAHPIYVGFMVQQVSVRRVTSLLVNPPSGFRVILSVGGTATGPRVQYYSTTSVETFASSMFCSESWTGTLIEWKLKVALSNSPQSEYTSLVRMLHKMFTKIGRIIRNSHEESSVSSE